MKDEEGGRGGRELSIRSVGGGGIRVIRRMQMAGGS